MAKVIEFYVPKNFRPQLKWAPQAQLGKIIEFRSEVEESVESYELNWIDRPVGIATVGNHGIQRRNRPL